MVWILLQKHALQRVEDKSYVTASSVKFLRPRDHGNGKIFPQKQKPNLHILNCFFSSLYFYAERSTNLNNPI
jgi:hypothetical protein